MTCAMVYFPSSNTSFFRAYRLSPMLGAPDSDMAKELYLAAPSVMSCAFSMQPLMRADCTRHGEYCWNISLSMFL